MRVLLPNDLAEIVRKKVETDRYEDAVDVIQEALHLLDAEEESAIAELREKVEAGERALERGEYTTINSKEELDAFLEDICDQKSQDN